MLNMPRLVWSISFVLALAWPALARAAVKVTVEANSIVAPATEFRYGINIFRGFNPTNAENPAYQAGLALINPAVVRFHSSGQATWIDHERKAWNTNNIRRVFAALGSKAPVRMVTIPKCPPWMDLNEDKRLDDGQLDAYAAWCAKLVDFLNHSLQARVQYWETFNEAELSHYTKKGDGKVLADIFRKCAAAMKRVDPTIKITGNAWSSASAPLMRDFLDAAGKEIDFFSYHAYGTGDATKSPQQLYDSALKLGRIDSMREKLDQRGLKIPIWLDEWNMFYNYKADEKRHLMASPKSAVFDALVFKQVAESKAIDYMLAWNECDGIYGKMSTSFKVRPAAHLFGLYRRYLTGNSVKSSSSEPAVVPLAVLGTNAAHLAVSLVNRSESSQTVRLSINGWKPAENRGERFAILPDGVATNALSPATLSSQEINLPAESVAICVWR